MILRLTVECIAYNVTMNIMCHKDTECVGCSNSGSSSSSSSSSGASSDASSSKSSGKEIELKITSARVRDKIKAFCQFTRVGVKEYIIVHKLVISRESKKIFVKTFNNR